MKNFIYHIMPSTNKTTEKKRILRTDNEPSTDETNKKKIRLVKNGKEIYLLYRRGLPDPPEDIGNLVSLEVLDLSQSNITSLPTSIGQLKNLKELYLSYTRELTDLPEEIANLVSLEVLDLTSSTITSLPTSIGQLKNLRSLSLSGTGLPDLPEEIGNLVSLEKLYLFSSNIASLPNSIGQLKNLKEFYLTDAKELPDLPVEIGNLVSLEVLDLSLSHIASLPTFIGQLKNLKSIYLQEASFIDYINLPDMIGNLDSLQNLYIGSFTYRPKLSPSIKNKIGYALMCKTARVKVTELWSSDAVSIQTANKLLPFLIYNATHPFHIGNGCLAGELASLRSFRIKKSQAIYQLLLDNREYFIRCLVNQSTL